MINKDYWKSKFKEISKTLLTPTHSPYAGRTTMFIGAIICFFCFCSIALAKRDGFEVPVIAVIFMIIGVVEIVMGLFEFLKQKKFEQDEKAVSDFLKSIEEESDQV